MIGGLIDGAIKRRKVVLGVTLVAAIFGFFAYLSMPREAQPDMLANRRDSESPALGQRQDAAALRPIQGSDGHGVLSSMGGAGQGARRASAWRRTSKSWASTDCAR